MSLGGVVEAPGGEPAHRNSGWTADCVDFDVGAYRIKADEQDEAGAMMPGRRSYDVVH